MKSLLEVTMIADELSFEDRAGLVTHLLAGFPSAPAGPDDSELEKREAELASGAVTLLDQAEFLRAVGR